MTTYTDIILQDTNGNFFIPYGFINRLGDVNITNPTQGQNLTFDAVNQVWKNTSTTATVAWGGITGTLSDQTDLQNALDSKLTSSDLANYVTTNTQQTITAQKTFNTRVNFLGSGDANAIYLSTDTRIDVNGTNNTVLGFASGTFLINNAAYNLRLRGKQTRPVYNSDSNPIALLSDVPKDTGDLTNNAGYIKGITSNDVTTALGFTPYSAANPNNYTSVVESTVSGWGFTKNTGTVTSVNNVSPVNGNVTLSIPSVEAYTAAEVETLWSSIS